MLQRLLILLGVFCCLAPIVGISETLEESKVSSASPVVVQADPDGVQRAVITLDSYSYSPAHLVIDLGKPVELTLKSVTVITPHNFILKERQAGLDVDVDVSAGESVVVKFVPTRAGLFTFFCDKKLLFFPSHREKGMEGRLEVRE